MAIDWQQTAQAAINAAVKVLANESMMVQKAAAHQIEMLAVTAKHIEDHKNEMSAIERVNIVKQQHMAFMAVLTGFSAIGLVLAQKALAAASDVLMSVLSGAVKSAFKVV